MRAVAMACAALLCGQVSAAAESRQACRPVFHSRLEALLPVLPGFGRNRPKGETDNLDAVSRTTVDYEAEAAVVSIELIDSCRNPDMLSQLREFLAQGPPATAGTVMRSVPILGFPAYEEWTQESRHGERLREGLGPRKGRERGEIQRQARGRGAGRRGLGVPRAHTRHGAIIRRRSDRVDSRSDRAPIAR